jgi:GNAT superfamily N-acetyltransferase
MAWIRNIGVREQARGHGLGGHLLRHACGVCAARGRDTIGLRGHRECARGDAAVRGHGITPVDTWEVSLSAGGLAADAQAD